MKAADHYTIETIGIPSLVLMERAALQVVETVKKEKIDITRSLIVCGSGNNGGDGIAVGRLLLEKGAKVTVVLAGNPDHCTEEAKEQIRIFQAIGGTVEREIPQESYTAVFDALFGIGLSRKVEGRYAGILERMNEMEAAKVAVDIPSGIDSSTGEVLGTAFQADLTVTFAYLKTGMALFPGALYAGNVQVRDIGIYLRGGVEGPRYLSYEREDIKTLCPKRGADAHKGTYGRVLMITGSEGMAGAAILSASAAYRMGSGVVRILTPRCNQAVLQAKLPEVIVTPYKEEISRQMETLLDWADVICAGCGLGMDERTKEVLETLLIYLENHEKPCVLDADALNNIAGMEQKKREMLLSGAGSRLIFTPHVKEFARLLGKTTEETKKSRMGLAQQYAKTYNIILAAKDARTVVAGKGKIPYLNLSGNSAMAKAGSGDVLAGMITGCLALGMERFEAAAFGVFVHGLCGDEARDRYGAHSVLATDLIEMTPIVLREIH
ncbi:NAD(P)H-hydrate dehydratase [Sellimonas intestinalis]|nr:NAD(P)H-hydrate dehydratase [Sellimonas intestinalis]RGE55482.1 NAD(P)H-hydrate dehydratase [Sellimonas intestinalis]